MLQHYSTTLPTLSNRLQVTNENDPVYSTYGQAMVGSNNGIQPLRRPTIHVPPPLSSVLCSNNQNFSLFSGGDDLSMPLSNEKHMNQYGVEHSTPQTISAAELKALTTSPCQSKDTPPPLTPRGRNRPSKTKIKTKTKISNKRQMDTDDDNDTSSLMDLSRRLRTNLSLAKQRMMTGLKQSTEPNDIAMYTRLENITLEDSSPSSPPPPRRVTSTIISKTVGNGRNLFPHHSHYSTRHHNDKYRVHKKKPYNNCLSSYMELQSNPNGYVSVVLRKSSTSSSEEAYATLTRSFSFTMRDSDSDSDSDSDEDTTMNEATAPSVSAPPPPQPSSSLPQPTDSFLSDWMTIMTMDQSNKNNTNDNVLSSTWMQQAALSLEPQPQDQGQAFYHFDDSTLDENNIDSWLQSGGIGCSPMVVATDQELADLLDFD
ncbi:hypothetical protein [Absidia glauca]|uniref:Uncharacterized protein n=1 Tax=Absidia glauca TaxID=4829 RepID=A0A163MUZ9_ABSGL|nr:hypothetical protein [Absidia glauca]